MDPNIERKWRYARAEQARLIREISASRFHPDGLLAELSELERKLTALEFDIRRGVYGHSNQ